MSLDALLDADFKTPPWDHQLREFELGVELRARALLWQMRTGKSKFCIDTASHLFRAGLIDAVLIFAPNGVHANWVEREVPKHLWDGIPVNSFAWRTRVAGVKYAERLSKADREIWETIHADWHAEVATSITSRSELAVFSFNSESMIREDVRRLIKRLIRERQLLVIWDESSDFRTPGSSRSRMARSIAPRVAFRRILDGTPLHNSPLHAFAQFELLERGALGFMTYKDFEDHFAEFVRERNRRTKKYYRVLKAYKNLDELRDSIAPFSSVVLRSDCSDLPALERRPVHIPLSPEQERVYREVEKSIRIEIEQGEIVSLRAQTSRLQKLQQVVGGWLIDKEKVKHKIPGVNPRLEACSKEVYLASGKVLVFCQFRHEIEEVAARLRADGYGVMTYYGGSTDDEKARVRNEFPTNEDKVVVAQPQSAGRGLEIPADLLMWYSHTWNGIIREQASERATVMGGANVNLVDLISPRVDPYILDTVARNVNIADDIAGRGLQLILDGPLKGLEDWL